MPDGLIITKNTNSVEVDFNDYAGTTPEMMYTKKTYAKERINNIAIHSSGHFVIVSVAYGNDWDISHDGNDTTTPTVKIKEVDTVAPTSVVDLYNKLKDLADH